MKAKAIGYWVATTIIALLMLSGGIFQLMRKPEAVEGIVHLGYPVYFILILGVWKVLGAIVLVAPGLPRVKEWAYAGIFFDLTGASASQAAKGGSAGNIIGPIVFVLVLYASWALRPASRRLGAAPGK